MKAVLRAFAYHSARVALLTAILCASTLGGCGKQAQTEDLFSKGEFAYLEAQYDEAILKFKAHLLERPNDAGAHLYLGESYLLKKSPSLVIAQGEIETALDLFNRNGGKNPIKRFGSAKYFELRCHLSLAKIRLRQILLLVELGQVWRIPPLIERCRDELDAASALAPDSPDVGNLRKVLDQVRELNAPEPTPSTPKSDAGLAV